MRTLRHVVLLLLGFSMWVSLLSPSLAAAAGPWKGQILDAETGQPLEGVVVLAYWIKYTSSFGGWGGGEFYDSEEVVTGADGHFVIQARQTWTLFWWRKIEGEFVIFKPGYGRWQFKGYEASKKLPIWEQEGWIETQWKRFTGDGAVIELSPLKTREERLKFYQSPGRTPVGFVPPERMRRFTEAENAERAHLGFRN